VLLLNYLLILLKSYVLKFDEKKCPVLLSMKMREQTLLAGEYCTLDGFFYIKEALLLLTALQWFYGEKLV
jgi:hypothetical protein